MQSRNEPNQIDFSHQRGGGAAGTAGNITFERVHIKSNFPLESSTSVHRCKGANIRETILEPEWSHDELKGEWKRSAKHPEVKIGTIPLEGEGLYFLRVNGYVGTQFEIIGQVVKTVGVEEIPQLLERMFIGQIADKRSELASRQAVRNEELKHALHEAVSKGWPALQGSEKQIAWALTIRAKVAGRNPKLPELFNKPMAKYWIDNHK